MFVRGIAFVMDAMVLADDNPVVVDCVFHRGSSKVPQYFGEKFCRSMSYWHTRAVKKMGSERESGKLCILRGFVKNEEFSLRGRQALRFEQQVIHVSITAAASEQSFDVAIDGFYHTHRYLRPAVVQDALQMIQQHAG